MDIYLIRAIFQMATAKSKPVELIHGIKPYRAKKREQYMNDDQQDHFKAILRAWQQELIIYPILMIARHRRPTVHLN